jgi:LacI family transcriptional regulator
MRDPRVGIIDVARLAGVSTGTVSHVLNGSANVKVQTEARVREAIRKLNYVPQGSGPRLRFADTTTVALLLATLGDKQSVGLAVELEETTRRSGSLLLMALTNGDSTRQLQYLSEFRRGHVDCVVSGPGIELAEE